MKEFLSHRGVTFTEKIIDEDAAAYDELLKLGYRTVPVTIIDGLGVAGFSPEALERTIRGAGQ